jgi:hypothetical protein
MKKASLMLLLLGAGLGVFAQSGTIKEISGVVETKPAGTASFRTARVGEQLSRDTVISTGFRSFAIVEIGSTSITVRPLTRLTLTEIQASADTETLSVNLQSGRVRVDVKPPAGTKAAMSVASPSATASVRGTSFEFDTRNLYVDEGAVSFMGKRGQTIQVAAGTSSRVEANAQAASPIEIKTAALFPSAPAGAEVNSGAAGSAPVRTGVPFTIDLYFHYD